MEKFGKNSWNFFIKNSEDVAKKTEKFGEE